jgi:hypothetical protein
MTTDATTKMVRLFRRMAKTCCDDPADREKFYKMADVVHKGIIPVVSNRDFGDFSEFDFGDLDQVCHDKEAQS